MGQRLRGREVYREAIKKLLDLSFPFKYILIEVTVQPIFLHQYPLYFTALFLAYNRSLRYMSKQIKNLWWTPHISKDIKDDMFNYFAWRQSYERINSGVRRDKEERREGERWTYSSQKPQLPWHNQMIVFTRNSRDWRVGSVIMEFALNALT